MKNTILFLMLSLHLSSNCLGNDTTLFNKRIAKIKVLATWLNQRPTFKIAEMADTALKFYSTYDTAINVFFTNSILNRKFDLKFAIYSFDGLLRNFPLDSFILKKPDILTDTLIYKGNYSSYTNNTLIFYLPMYNEEYQGFYFTFKKNKDELIYLIAAGGTNEDYKNKKKFLNNLK